MVYVCPEGEDVSTRDTQRRRLAPVCRTAAAAVLCLAHLAPGQEPADSYPKTAGVMKAMLQILAPERGMANTREAYIQRLKQYRYICDVPYEDLHWDDNCARLARAAADVCARLGKMTHSPSRPSGMSDEDYALARKGAGECNLFSGRVDPVSCVDGWMADSDPGNIDRVGHRRWCLNPRMLKTAFGSSGAFAAMYAFDSSRKSLPEWEYVAYPARGYMPCEFFGGQQAWSVLLNPARYGRPSKGEVRVEIHAVAGDLTPVGGALKIGYFNVENSGFGCGPAIIFRPEGFSPGHDQRYKVDIRGLKAKSDQTTLSYLVHFVQLSKVPDTAEGRAACTAHFRKRLAAAQATADPCDRLEALTAILEDDSLPVADAAVAAAARNSLSELLKDPKLRREHEAYLSYQALIESERKAGRSKTRLTQVALAFRDLAQAYKGTRAGERAAVSFERLKALVQ
jgi:uncharacterized protein YkwD